MRKAILTAALAATVSTLALSACSTGTTGSTDATGPAGNGQAMVNKNNWPKERPASGLTKGLRLPLEDYMQSYADSVSVDNAERDLQQKCMADYGFTVSLPRPGVNPPPSNDDANMERRYGISDRTTAAKYGYQLPEALTHSLDQHLPNLPEVQVEVLTGHTKPTQPAMPKGAKNGTVIGSAPRPTAARKEYQGKKLHAGGCIGYSRQQLNAPQPDYVFVSNLSGESLLDSQKSKPVQKAIKSWSSCMTSKGHTAADPYKAMDQGVTADGKPTKQSIALALDDIDCKQSTNLVKTWFNQETKIEKQQIKDNAAKLGTVKNGKAKQVKAAVAHTVR
jgi:hypothetical protein